MSITWVVCVACASVLATRIWYVMITALVAESAVTRPSSKSMSRGGPQRNYTI